MSKYGFDPSELIETKIDLIDKDGFHGVGEAGSNGNNSGNATGSSNIYLGIDKTSYEGNHLMHVLVYLTKEDYPELFVGENLYLKGFSIYKGDRIDSSELTVDDESGSIYYGNNKLGESLSGSNTDGGCDDFVYKGGYFYYDFDYSNNAPESIPLTFPKDIAKGETAHVVLWLEYNVGAVAQDVPIQIDVTWPADPNDFEE